MEDKGEKRKGGERGKTGLKQRTPSRTEVSSSMSAAAATARAEAKMTTRPRRDSTSSLAAAMQVKAQKDTIGDDARRPVVRMDRDKETENEARKLKARSPKMEKFEVAKREKRDDSREKKETKSPAATPVAVTDALELEPIEKEAKGKKKVFKKRGKDKKEGDSGVKTSSVTTAPEHEENQHLASQVEVAVGDKIKVFYKSNTIYEAKVIRMQERAGERWPRYLVHYQGWNARYDEWIRRSKIAENMSWSKEREQQKVQHQHHSEEQDATAEEREPLRKEGRPSKERKEPSSGSLKQHQEKEKTTLTRAKSSKTSSSAAVSAPARSSEVSDDVSSTPSGPSSRTRTGSPALKRQSSRTSVKKESEESGGEEESSSSAEDVRKSARLQQHHKPSASMPGAGTTGSSSTDSRRSSRYYRSVTAIFPVVLCKCAKFKKAVFLEKFPSSKFARNQ